MSTSVLQSLKKRWYRLQLHEIHCLQTPKEVDSRPCSRQSAEEEAELLGSRSLPTPTNSAAVMDLKLSRSSPGLLAQEDIAEACKQDGARAYMNLSPQPLPPPATSGRVFRSRPCVSSPPPRTYENIHRTCLSSGARGSSLTDDLSLIYMGLDFSSGEGRPYNEPRPQKEVTYAQLDLDCLSGRSSPQRCLSCERLPGEISYMELDFNTMQALVQTAEETSEKPKLWGAGKPVKRTSSLSRLKHSFAKPLRLLTRRSPSE